MKLSNAISVPLADGFTPFHSKSNNNNLQGLDNVGGAAAGENYFYRTEKTFPE